MARRPTKSESLRLRSLLNGEEVAESIMRGPVFEELIADGHFIRIRKGSGRGSYKVKNREYLIKALRQKWQIEDLEGYMDFLDKENKSRIDVQKFLGGTKETGTKTFKGFLVNTLSPLPYCINGKQDVFHPCKGIFVHVYDYETFRIPPEVTVMYVENFTVFANIDRYVHLFGEGRYLFVSRLQSSSSFDEWIKSIPNKYVHFGDFDLPGISIYLGFYNEIGERASFLIPEDIESRIASHGNSKLFYKHEKDTRYRNMKVSDPRVQPVVDLIHKYRMEYEQEGYAE